MADSLGMEILRSSRSLFKRRGKSPQNSKDDDRTRSNFFKIPNNQPTLVFRPLASAVFDALEIPEEQRTEGETRYLSDAIIDHLNAKIASCPVLWSLGRLQVMGISQGVVLKVGEGIDLEEVSTLEMIKKLAPQVPIADILGTLRSGKLVYLFMTLIQGQTLDSVWSDLTSWQKRQIQKQLNVIFTELRAVKRPDKFKCQPLLGGGDPPKCKDMRREIRVADGEISNEAEFNDFLVGSSGNQIPEFGSRELIRSYLRNDHEIVLTHADLHPRNIMVVKRFQTEKGHQPVGEELSYHITGILDWEMSGWYPSYWEYVKALHTASNDIKTADWWAYLPTAAIGSWPAEHAIDLMISRWLF